MIAGSVTGTGKAPAAGGPERFPGARNGRIFWALVAFIAVVAGIRVAATLRLFSQTADEGVHVVAGLRWLAEGKYDTDLEHPPLARIVLALDAYREGLGSSADGGSPERIFNRPGSYIRHLGRARAPNLVFLLVLIVTVAAWTRRAFGPGIALAAAALTSLLPPVLAHAGFATTDMAATATVTLALYLFTGWLHRPTLPSSILTGVAVGLGLLSKFSFIVYFFPAALVFGVAAWIVGAGMRPDVAGAGGRRIGQVSIAAVVAFFVLWGGYRFSTGRLLPLRVMTFQKQSAWGRAAAYAQEPGYEWVRPDLVRKSWAYGEKHPGFDFVDWAKAAGYPSPLAGRRGDTMAGRPRPPAPSLRERVLEPLRAFWQRAATERRMPFPEFLVGLERLMEHSELGHLSFLLGEHYDGGKWQYFPVIFFYKSPLAFVLLSLTGAFALGWHGLRASKWEQVAVAGAPFVMLLPSLTTSINIGVRHILPLYPLLAMSAAWQLNAMWHASRAGTAWRACAAALALWMIAAGALAHPHYVSYFNELAGKEPERVAVDSNLDWGQDLLFLAKLVKEKRIEHLYLSYWGPARWETLVPEAEKLHPFHKVTGWVAISEMDLTFGGEDRRGSGFRWLRRYRPVAKAGRSIKLYYIPPD